MFGDFRIIELLADDAGLALYAVDRLGAPAALRVFDRFGPLDGGDSGKLTEAALAGAAVGSDKVPSVRLAGVDPTTGVAWVATDPVAGKSLASTLKEGEPLDPCLALAVIADVAEALGRAHMAGQAHGELTTVSIFVADSAVGPTVTLLDLGTLRWLNQRHPDSTQALGFRECLPPEQLQQGAAAAPPADTWALGLLAFRLLVGRSYWLHTSTAEVVDEITAQPLPSASKRVRDLGSPVMLPPGFDEWFARSVTRDPKRRFAHGSDAAQALRPLLSGVRAAAAAAAAAVPPWGAIAAPATPAAAPPIAEAPAQFGAPPAAFSPYAAGPFPPPRPTDRAGGGGGGSGAPVLAVIVGLLLVVGVIGVIGAFGVGGVLAYRRGRVSKPHATAVAPAGIPPSHATAPVPVLNSDPVWGDTNAPVTIVEFSDLQCPFCARAQKTLDAVKTTYGPSQVRIVFKHNPLPFHKQALPAAEAAERVRLSGGNAAFFKFADLAFADSKSLNDASFESWATIAGADMTTYRSLMGASIVSAKVQADIDLAKRVGVTGVPAFRINGQVLSGAQPLEKFRSLIDSELTEAKKRIAAGTPPDQIYPILTGENHRTTPTPSPPPATAEPDGEAVWKVPVLADDPQLGPADALVTLVEFGDFQCPFCKRLDPTLRELRDRYGNDLRLVWKDNPLPFHKQAEPAAQLARVIFIQRGDPAFWRAHDALFANQPDLGDAEFQKIASAAGLGWGSTQSAMSSPTVAQRVRQSQTLASALKASGTPSCFINGRLVTGAVPASKFQEVIDQELAKARQLIARGTPRSQVYETVIREGKQESPFEMKQARLLASGVPIRGPANAKVTVHIFSDFQCPFCARAAPTLAELQKSFPTDVRLAWHDLPLGFHKQAQLAAEAAREVQAQLGDAGFWRFHDRLFEEQKSPGGLEREHLERVAQSLGCNMPKFRRALDDRVHRARVQEDADAASQAGIRGTPSFLVAAHRQSSGEFYYLSGAQPLPKFERVVSAALGR